mmetsp:Transcript_51275/g.125904  ORF Transcript_51275/g.125904 Transcript_51275/m.125904 type:complete len:197 (-) Transcript_51275:125-715(-)
MGSTYGDGQFLFVDLFLVIPLGIAMGDSAAARGLSRHMPPRNLRDRRVSVPTITACGLLIVFQLLALVAVRALGFGSDLLATQQAVISKGHLKVLGPENSVLFLFTNFQYVIACIAFNLGPPFRARFNTNRHLRTEAHAMLLLCAVLLLSPPGIAARWLELEQLPWSVRVLVLVLATGNLVVLLGVEAAFGAGGRC